MFDEFSYESMMKEYDGGKQISFMLKRNDADLRLTWKIMVTHDEVISRRRTIYKCEQVRVSY